MTYEYGCSHRHRTLIRAVECEGADLRDADLRGANLAGARGWVPQELPPASPSKIAAWKLVTADGRGIFRDDSPVYEAGRTYEADLNRDTAIGCAPGLHVASLSWCMAEWEPGRRLLVCEMDPADVVIPLGRPGKFRAAKLTVTGEMRI